MELEMFARLNEPKDDSTSWDSDEHQQWLIDTGQVPPLNDDSAPVVETEAPSNLQNHREAIEKDEQMVAQPASPFKVVLLDELQRLKRWAEDPHASEFCDEDPTDAVQSLIERVEVAL